MKKLLLFLVIVLASTLHAQPAPETIHWVFTNPSGGCGGAPGYITKNMTTGDTVRCVSGQWTVDTSRPPGPIVGAATWGSITGTLGSQTDLQTALDLKAPLASPTFTGTVTGAAFSGPLAGAVTGNSSTATALASTPTKCSAGNYPLGINAAGDAQNCTLAAGGITALTGDGTASGSGSVPLTIVKVNGTTVPTNAAADQVVVTTASAVGTWASIGNCGDGTHALAYSTSTHLFSCQALTGATSTGGAGVFQGSDGAGAFTAVHVTESHPTSANHNLINVTAGSSQTAAFTDPVWCVTDSAGTTQEICLSTAHAGSIQVGGPTGPVMSSDGVGGFNFYTSTNLYPNLGNIGRLTIVNNSDSMQLSAIEKALLIGSGFMTKYSSATTYNGTIDLGHRRSAAGFFEVNNGTAAAFTNAAVKTGAYVAAGAVPSISGCATVSAQTGGNTAGTFTTSTAGTCTAVLTFAVTAPTGWMCNAADITQHVTANALIQSGSTTTTATITGTTAASDVIAFSCMAY